VGAEGAILFKTPRHAKAKIPPISAVSTSALNQMSTCHVTVPLPDTTEVTSGGQFARKWDSILKAIALISPVTETD
jgi:hypothetical protein